MKIISNKKWNGLQDLITGLQQDYNDLKDKQIDLQLELKYMQEQKELAERQVEYLQNELRRANDIKKPILKLETTPKRGRKPRKEKEDGTKR